MTPYLLRLDITSDALFGRGDGIAGLLDLELQHDAWGCPFLAGRTLKGLLAEECANILYALDRMGKCAPWLDAADALFGVPGSTPGDRGSLTVGNAQWPVAMRDAVRAAVDAGAIRPAEVLDAAGLVRRQTALDPITDSPRKETLRTARALVREMQLEAELELAAEPDSLQAALLAACVKALRRAGTGRNRGRGELRATLLLPSGAALTKPAANAAADAAAEPAADAAAKPKADPKIDPWGLFLKEVTP